jgi:hypothetical protein
MDAGGTSFFLGPPASRRHKGRQVGDGPRKKHRLPRNLESKTRPLEERRAQQSVVTKSVCRLIERGKPNRALYAKSSGFRLASL